MKIRPVGVELLHPDHRINRRAEDETDMANLTVAFRNFCDLGGGGGGKTSEITLRNSSA